MGKGEEKGIRRKEKNMQPRAIPLVLITIITIISLRKFLCRIMFFCLLRLYDLMFLVYKTCVSHSAVQIIGHTKCQSCSCAYPWYHHGKDELFFLCSIFLLKVAYQSLRF